jgi:hypothetical protein
VIVGVTEVAINVDVGMDKTSQLNRAQGRSYKCTGNFRSTVIVGATEVAIDVDVGMNAHTKKYAAQSRPRPLLQRQWKLSVGSL